MRKLKTKLTLQKLEYNLNGNALAKKCIEYRV